MSAGASVSLPDGLFAPYELVRELGARPNPVYVVRQSGAAAGGKNVLAVAERFAGAGKTPDGELLVREARRLATLASPNLARVREVVVRGDDLLVLGELVEGEKLEELWHPDKLPLEIALRVVVDVLTGVGAVHNLRDARQQPMKLAHGEVSPATVVFGLDGLARLLYSTSRRAPGVVPEAGSVGYLSPEVASGDAYDARADVFSVGVLLWEALSGKRLFTDGDPRANAKRVRSGVLPPATVPEKARWAKGLVEVVARALSAAPDDRWPTAAVLAAEVRKAAGLKLAPASTAASFARGAFGERVKARREALDVSIRLSRPPPPAPASVGDEPPTKPPVAPEPSFVELELESAIDTVLVAPGIRANVEEVVELESGSLIEAASERPPAPPPAMQGFVLDPFAVSAASARSPRAPDVAWPTAPPPMPTVSAAPVPVVAAPVVMVPPPGAEEPQPPSITGAPHFAAAMNLPPPTSPVMMPLYVAAPPVASMPLVADVEELDVLAAGARRRKVIVLAGVGALGLLVFLLAMVRLATRTPDATPVATRPASSTVSASPPPASPPPIPPAAAAASTVSRTGTVPVVTAATPPALAPKPVATPAPKPTPVVAAAPPRTAPASRPAATPKPRPKPTFDPNSL